jgi:hypothetical protein
MLKLVKYFLWIVVIAALTVGFDQVMVRVPLSTPGLKQTQRFYVDFRSRLVRLLPEQTKSVQPVDVIEAVITKKTAPIINKTKQAGQRYLYVDDSGTLQFTDSLQQVPKKYRQDAQPLAE